MYESYFGLTAKPFQLNPDPAFYFGSRGHKSAYAYLQYGVYQGEGFIVVTGEIGAGKTTLARALLQQLDPSKVVAVQLVSTMIDGDQLLKAVATAFGVMVRGTEKAELLATLEAFLTSLAAENKRALLVVDEAQNLSGRAMEELRMLSNFQFGDRALLQSFLVGQPELRRLLRAPQMEQLRQRVIASYHLGPMDAEETARYILHRLQLVGWKGNPSFSPEAMAAIYSVTGGVPRRINTLCNRLMLSLFLGEKHAAERADVESVAIEISRELGPAAVPNRPADAAGVADMEDASTPAAHLSTATAAGIAARLDRIERSVNSLHEMLGARTREPRRVEEHSLQR
ncbi:MAG: XrtA/PEP-CTERM system-associated ATPase [Burkholderiaceae bacterium]